MAILMALSGSVVWFSRDYWLPAAPVEEAPPNGSLAATSGANDVSGFRVITYDLGNVAPKNLTEGVVRIANDVDRPCTVKHVWSDCGCVVSELKERTARPGERWELKFQYRAPDSPRRIAQRIILRFEEAGIEPVMVHIRGAVRAWAEAIPAEISLGEVCSGNLAVTRLEVFTPDRGEELPAPEVTGLSWLDVKTIGSEQVFGSRGEISGTMHHFRVRFSPPPDADAGRCRGEIVFRRTPVERVLRVPCTAMLLPRIDVAPKEAFLGAMPVGVEKSCTIRLRVNEPGARVRASAAQVRADQEFVRAELSATDDPDEFRLTVKAVRRRDDRPGLHRGAVTVAIGAGPAVRVPVFAWFD